VEFISLTQMQVVFFRLRMFCVIVDFLTFSSDGSPLLNIL